MDNKRKKKLIWQLPFLALLIIGTVLIVHQQRNAPYQKHSGFIFGTMYNVSYQSSEDLQSEIEAELKKVDAEFSMFNEASTVSRLNRGEHPTLSADFIKVYKLAHRISEATQGAFDITVAPLVNAWGFGFKHETMPTRQQVDSLRQLIGYQHVKLQQQSLTMQKPGMMLDFSAIAKGFGVDVITRLMEQHDIHNFMIEIGGEVTTRGVNPQRVPWRIGVSKPTEDSLAVGNEYLAVLNVTDRSMATSGNYRNFYYKNGHKYAHTIDPRTGFPVQHSLLSATVLAPDCATADAYATSFMVLGLEEAQRILSENKQLMAYLVYTDRQGNLCIWHSRELKVES